jgi:hypothetical protein
LKDVEIEDDAFKHIEAIIIYDSGRAKQTFSNCVKKARISGSGQK